MAQQDLVKLASQGRAYSSGRAWTAEELESLITLERECGLKRDIAADYIRNGVITPDEYEKAQKADFAPKSLEVLQAESVIEHSKKVRTGLKLDEAPKKEKAKAEKEVVKKAADTKAKDKE